MAVPSLPQGREMSFGFTLIELLVVVLIIGILAAIAVPQYRLAVLKSRGVEARTALSALEKAQQSYQLATGQCATDLSVLDITLPASITGKCIFLDNTCICMAFMENNRHFESYTRIGKSVNPDRRCVVKDTDELGKKWCQLYGRHNIDKEGKSFYYLNF